MIQDHLDHEWNDELVGFKVDGIPLSANFAVADEGGKLHPCQFAQCKDGMKVYFRVDKLPALGSREFRLVESPRAAKINRPAIKAKHADGTIAVGNKEFSLKIPAGLNADGSAPAPVLGVRSGKGKWIGNGRIKFSDWLKVQRLTTEEIESGPLWKTYKLTYDCGNKHEYFVTVKIFSTGTYAEIREESHLLYASHWELSLKKGLEPDHYWTHRNKLVPINFQDSRTKGNIGAIQMPVYSGIWVPDDYYYVALMRQSDGTGTAVCAAGINGGFWDYPYENQIDLERRSGGDAFLKLSIKAGHRAWLLCTFPQAQITGTEPVYNNPLNMIVKKYETPLDKIKDWVLEWDDVPDAQRPFALADKEQLKHAAKNAKSYKKMKDYVAALNPDLPGDYTYYHAGTHRVFKDDYRNDPAVLFVTAEDCESRRKQARFLKDVVMTGMRHRCDAMLKKAGHVDHDCASINVGRGMRPWSVLYDFAASEGVFSEAENKLAKAMFAFWCYKIMDPDFWPADHLVFRDDHPRSAHRTHWFPDRQSDWAMYNIDNIPHNFHGDLWSAAGCAAMVFPKHPESRNWVNRTLEFWENELKWWVFPDGPWLESSTYTLNSMKDYIIYCRMLSNAKIRDYFTDERMQRAMLCIVEHLGPADKRINGRTVIVMGDGGYPNVFCYVLGWMAGLSKHDPDFAGKMSYGWKQTGEYLTEPGRFGLNFCDFLFIDPEIPEQPLPALKSKWYRGLGAFLRHAHGTPDEILAFIKGGIIYSHFHEPEGTFQLWWNGVPICDEYGVQYGKGDDGRYVWEPANHNCIEIPGDNTCYNKGDITTFISNDQFDYVVVEAPKQLAWARENEGIWGFKGEMGPAAWMKRIFLLVKPYYLYVYDELECPYPTIYNLNVKADSYAVDGNKVHFVGRYGTDLEFSMLNLGGKKFRFGEFNVRMASSSSFNPPDKFYHQHQLHVDGAPYENFASILVPHRNTINCSVENDSETGGAIVRYPGMTERAMVFPKLERVEAGNMVFHGLAGSIREEKDKTTFMLAAGDSIGLNGNLIFEGDGPFTAVLDGNGKLNVESDGVARWLKIKGKNFSSCICDGKPVQITKTDGACEIYVPAGKHNFQFQG